MRRRVVLTGEVGFHDGTGLHPVRGRQAALVVIALALAHRPVRPEELAEVLWPDGRPTHWRGALRGVVAKVRAQAAMCGIGVVTTTQRGVLLDRFDDVVVDVAEAAALTVRAEQLLELEDVSGARRSATDASVLLAEPFLPGEDAPWAETARDRIDGLRRRATIARAEAELADGRPSAATAIVEGLIDKNPYDEEVVRLLMRVALADDGRARAMSVYERLRKTLDDDLGVRPSPSTDALLLEVLGASPDDPLVSAPQPLPSLMASEHPFVGRRAELSRLDDAARRASDGLTVVIVEGPSGMGKTRLVSEWATRRPSSARTLVGRCTGARVAFEPFLEALPGGLPLPSIDSALPGWESHRREVVVGAVRDQLRALAGDVDPLALVVDDLQQADLDTIDLLRHLAGALRSERILAVLIARDPPPPVASILADLTRQGAVTVSLAGLAADEVAHLVAPAGDGAPDLAARLHRHTGGNPLYLTQLLDEALASGRPVDPEAVPDDVRDLVRRRIAALDRACIDVLAIAAVAGPAVDFGVVAACSSLDAERLGDAVELLRREGFLTTVEGSTLRWSHPVVHQAALDAIPDHIRTSHHGRVASLLSAGAPAGRVAELYRGAGPSGAAEAHRWALRAGAEALDASAWHLAEAHLTTALGSPDPRERCEALIGIGRARRGRGDLDGAGRSLRRAVDLAGDLGAARLRATATLALVGGGGRGAAVHTADAERARIIRRAIDDLVDGQDDDLLVPLRCELALSLVLTDDTARERASLVAGALESARRHGSPALVATALAGHRTVLLDAMEVDHRLQLGRTALDLVRGSRSREALLSVLLGLVEDLLVKSSTAEAAALLEEGEAVADTLDHPWWSWAVAAWQVVLDVARGRLEAAEERSLQALSLQPDHPEAVAAFGVQLVNLRLLQGRASEVLDLLLDATEANPQIPTYRAVTALCAAHAGDEELARAGLAALVVDGEVLLPPDSNRYLGLAVLADTCAILGDRTRARPLLGLLEPYSGLDVVLNCYGGGGAYWGPAERICQDLSRLLAGDLAG